MPGVTLWITQDEEFAVLDGNAFDDCEAAFQLAPGKYNVHVVAKAKPGKYTDVTGWVYADDNTSGFYYLDIWAVRVTNSKNWNDVTHIFFVSDSEDPFGLVDVEDMWVFDYMNALGTDVVDPNIVDTAYFWQFDNHGNKLVQVRFYPI